MSAKFLTIGFVLFTLLASTRFFNPVNDAIFSNTEPVIIKPAADRPEVYLGLLRNKRVGLVINHTARVGEVLLPDYLVSNGIGVERIFAPEHGFRVDASAGEKVMDGIDPQTGIQVVSLYGNVTKPTPLQLEGLDVLVFDIQDVGCRFYTYLSTLYLCMEACAENGLPLIVLDRPNPNGDYIAGPMLDPKFSSFVGMVPVPVVHGCTLGEMALMINGENWHKGPSKTNLTVIPVENYTHSTLYEVPVAPSPNLPNHLAVRLYPSLCFFEATTVSIGRGTPFPFQVVGGTLPHLGKFEFVPVNLPGIAVNPPNMNKTCFGVDLRELDEVPMFTLKWFLDFYHLYPAEKQFLQSERTLQLLSGSDRLLANIRAGMTENEMVALWQNDIDNYKVMRKKYLLYPDFE